MPRPSKPPEPSTPLYQKKLRVQKQPKARRAALHPLDAMGPIAAGEDAPSTSGEARGSRLREYRTTRIGRIFLGDSLELLRGRIGDSSVDLIMTSPPFGPVRKKDYGNVDAHD